RPELVNLGDDPTVQAAAPVADRAAGKARELFDILYFGRPQGGDAAVGEIGLVVEGSGIAEIVRQLELGGKAESVAVVEDRHLSAGGCICGGVVSLTLTRIGGARAVNAQADAGVNGFALAGRGLEFFGFDVDG